MDVIGDLSAESVELSVRPFADLDDRPRIVAYSRAEPARVILGLADVEQGERRTFIEAHLREAYLDPVGDPAAWRALIAALGDEGINFRVAQLKVLPFSVEFGP